MGSVEEHDRVGWRGAWLISGSHGAGIDLARLRAKRVMNNPRRAGNLRRIGVTETHALERLKFNNSVVAHTAGSARGGNSGLVGNQAHDVGFADAAPLVARAVLINKEGTVEANPQIDLSGGVHLAKRIAFTVANPKRIDHTFPSEDRNIVTPTGTQVDTPVTLEGHLLHHALDKFAQFAALHLPAAGAGNLGKLTPSSHGEIGVLKKHLVRRLSCSQPKRQDHRRKKRRCIHDGKKQVGVCSRLPKRTPVIKNKIVQKMACTAVGH